MIKSLQKIIINNQAAYQEKIAWRLLKKLRKNIRAGFREGAKNKIEKLNNFANSIEEILKDTSNFKKKLSIDIAKNLIEQEISSNKNYMVNIVVELLKNFSPDASVEILTNSGDAKTIEDSLEQIFVAIFNRQKIIVRTDSSIAKGSVILKANRCIIDGQISTKIKRAEEILWQF